MASAKKKAKVGSRSVVKPGHESSTTRSVLLCGTHRMTENGTGKTVCGLWGQGWTMGKPDDVKCEGCRG